MSLTSPAEAHLRYLVCSVESSGIPSEQVLIRYDDPITFVERQSRGSEVFRMSATISRRGSLEFRDSHTEGGILVSWTVDLKKRTLEANTIVGGEGHLNAGSCIEHTGPQHTSNDKPWFARKPGPFGAQPIGNPTAWITLSDYPSPDIRAGHAGTVYYTLKVAANGQPSDCLVSGSSGYPGLDSTTCALLINRARFTPAIDTAGNPVVGSYSGKMRWTPVAE